MLVYTVFRVLEYFWLGRTFSLALLGADVLLGAAAGLILQDFCFALDIKRQSICSLRMMNIITM